MVERERKFLLNPDYTKSHQFWDELAEQIPELINQGYLIVGAKKHLRVRTIQKGLENKGYICYKSFISDTDRNEFEYEIPYKDAVEMLLEAECSLTKTRYKIPGQSIDIDVYTAGLVIIEIEFTPDKPMRYPYYCGREVTGDERYSNITLAKKL